MKRLFIFLFFMSTIALPKITAQGYAFGVKGGLAIGQQNWNTGGSSTNSLLFKYQGAMFIESLSQADGGQSVLFAQLGYHLRGSAFRYRSGLAYDPSGTLYKSEGFKEEFIFKNIGLILGAKRRGIKGNPKLFYTVGLRGEYTIGTNLDADRNIVFASTYPQKEFVRKIQGGLTLTGGYEFPFSELVGGMIEFSVHPDLTRQYFRPEFLGYDPFNRVNVNVPAQAIRNISFEISLGFRFLRKVEYVD